MRFGQALLDDLRDAIPLSSIVGRYVIWDKRKTNQAKRDYWACCPFHGEKTPSFHADDRKGIYHCFGCGVTGDAFRFLVERQGRTFPEAVEEVASAAGISLPKDTPEAREAAHKRLTAIEISDRATEWFAAQLRNSPATMEYVTSRGITHEEIARYRIGYAPEDNALLRSKLAPVDQLVTAGLAGVVDDRSFDWFRGRLTFPVLDAKGHTLGFSARTLDGSEPKYINTPATQTFDKGSLLYNGAAARSATLDGKQMVVVEGNIDSIATDRAGFAGNAPMGTAITLNQIKLVAKSSTAPIFCFDGDAAGRKAGNSVIDLVLPMASPSFTGRFAFLPDGIDPDKMVRRSIEAFSAVIEGAIGLADALWRRETTGVAIAVPEQRAKLEGRLRAALTKIADTDTRRAYSADFADRLKSFGERPKVYRSNSYSNHSTAPSAVRLVNGPGKHTGITLKEAVLIGSIAAAPRRAYDLAEELTAARLSPEASRLVAKLVVAMMDAPESAIEEILSATGQSDVVAEAVAQARAAGVDLVIGAESEAALEVLNSVKH